jgi:hypothetical protein
MFEGMSDGEVAAVIEDATRDEAASGARRLAAIAELTHRRVDIDGDQNNWACDFWSAAAAEIAAAMTIGARAASREMRISIALRDRLPMVGALYAQGRLSSRVVGTVTWRTRLVEDEDAIALIDAAIAHSANRLGPMTNAELERAIDVWVAQYDPDAVSRHRNSARDRDISIGHDTDETGTSSIWGRLLGTDAHLLRKRLAAMVTTVCDKDPRTAGQRRADAMGAMAAGDERLACQCGDPACPGAGPDGRATSLVIHLIADPTAITDTPDPRINGGYLTRASTEKSAEEADDESEGADDEKAAGADTDNRVEENAAAKPAKPVHRQPALIVGGGAIPTGQLAHLIRDGAKITPLQLPGPDAEKGYVPSSALAAFVRLRDMTCRFPGCNRPADHTDIDHTIAYPRGPTHPTNLNCECRTHHLLKTFYPGWQQRQFPDGTIIWTTPAGRTYVTHPGSQIVFPHWNITTADLPDLPPPAAPTPNRGLAMPRRKTTRAKDRSRQIKAEREANRQLRSVNPPLRR